MTQYIANRFKIAHLTSAEIASLDGNTTMVVLPLAAVEQHGPHLPVLTDAMIVEAVLARALASRTDDGRVWALPVQAYGKSNEHHGFAGTFGLRAETLAATLKELARGVWASGIKRLFILNSHGGNPEIVDYVARDLREELGLLCFTAHPFRFGLAREIISNAEQGFGIHGGEAETSVMLAIAPELVKSDRYVAELPHVREALGKFTLKGGASFGWLTSDFSRSGTIGDPHLATAAKGEAILEAEAALVVELLERALSLSLPSRFGENVLPE